MNITKNVSIQANFYKRGKSSASIIGGNYKSNATYDFEVTNHESALAWYWILLIVIGGLIVLGLTGYFSYKCYRRKKDDSDYLISKNEDDYQMEFSTKKNKK